MFVCVRARTHVRAHVNFPVWLGLGSEHSGALLHQTNLLGAKGLIWGAGE